MPFLVGLLLVLGFAALVAWEASRGAFLLLFIIMGGAGLVLLLFLRHVTKRWRQMGRPRGAQRR